MKLTRNLITNATRPLEVPCDSWEHFNEQCVRLEEICAELRRNTFVDARPVFRGHASASWKLETTLEREHALEKLSSYYDRVWSIRLEIESATGKSWELPNPLDFLGTLVDYPKTKEGWLLDLDEQVNSYLIYLRHHGFPSPLLDWTASRAIAAFFAFEKVRVEKDDCDCVEIVALIPQTDISREMKSGQPYIYNIGHSIRTHRRHFLQKAEYTICLERDDSGFHIANHGYVTGRDPGFNVIVKFSIPRSERVKVLQTLDSYNLNAYSLYGSEDALMSSLAMNCYEFRAA